MAKKKTTKKKQAGEPYKKMVDGKAVWYEQDGTRVTHQGYINILNSGKLWKKGVAPKGAGRPKGSKNRSTLLKEMLALAALDRFGKPITNPLVPNAHEAISLEEAMIVNLVKMSLGNKNPTAALSAIKEIQDTLHGKIKNTNEDKLDITTGGEKITLNINKVISSAGD